MILRTVRAHFTHFVLTRCSRPARLRRLAGGLLVCLLLLAGTLTPVRAEDDPSRLSPEGERAALLINQLRANAGLPPLRVHPLLTLAANLHIQDMISSRVWGHTGSDGSSVHVRVARTGYRTDGWNGENWAVSATVEKSVYWWMDDAPHRENVLNRFYTEMGIGTAPHPKGWGTILVVDFSTGSLDGPGGYLPGGQETPAPLPVTGTGTGAGTVDGASVVSDSGLRHSVQPGETLYTLGLRYGVSWQEIAQLNGLGPTGILQIGAVLRIPGSGEAAFVSSPAAPAAQANVPQAEQTYTVAPGDTLLGIALRFGVDWQTLAAANGLDGRSVLQIGDRLVIPGVGQAGAGEAVGPARSHTVRAGETVWSIAAHYGVTWQRLLAANGLSESALLQIGQELTLP